jgi:cold shock CspA family protein
VIKGKITKWLDDRGFGFVTSEAHLSGIFLHCSAVWAKPGETLSVGMELEYRTDTDKQGRPRGQRAGCERRDSLMCSAAMLGFTSSPQRSRATASVNLDETSVGGAIFADGPRGFGRITPTGSKLILGDPLVSSPEGALAQLRVVQNISIDDE